MLSNLSGKKFGKLQVIEITSEYDKCRRPKWRCICDCGNEVKVVGSHLKNGHSKSCGCIKKTNHYAWKGYGEISGSYWGRVKQHAREKKLDFCLSIEDGWNLFQKQAGQCAITGVPLKFIRNYHNGTTNNQTASLDRIDSNLGYILGNVQWVHSAINLIKCDLSTAELEVWAELICNPAVESLEPPNQIVSRRKCEGHWRGFEDISGEYWNKVKYGAITRNLDFNITIEYAWNIFLKQEKKCALTRKHLTFVRNYYCDRTQQTASLDRIDSACGYVEGNVQWIHKAINRLKWDLPQNELLHWCKLIFEHSQAQ